MTCRALSGLLFAPALLLAPLPAAAVDLRFPRPVLDSVAEPAVFDSYDLPVGPWADGTLPVRRLEGMVDRRAWQIDLQGASLLEILAPLRDGLQAEGYTLLLDCETRGCGGFDFRFATEVMPEPGMHVDLGEFRFVSAQRGDEAVSLFVSRSGGTAFVQMIAVGKAALPPPAVLPAVPSAPVTAPPAAPAEAIPPPVPAPAAVPPADLAGRLDAGLSVALDDLVFASGSAALAQGDFPSLAALAAWLAADPARRVILVGHTDGSGGLAPNIALSKKRAAAVRQVLVDRYGVRPGQISAEGVGPLAPRDSDQTEAGRLKNRRVEAVPAPT